MKPSFNRAACRALNLTTAFSLLVLFAVVAPVQAKERPYVERFDNGLTLVAEPREGAPVTAVQLWVRAGSVDEEELTVGLSHFLEHMLFKGTATRPVGEIHETVEKHGGEINAATSDDWTYYHITITSDEWRRALDIILDIAVNASFPAEEVEREREVVKEEIARRNSNPMTVLYDLLGPAAYQDHPYRFRTIGDYETLSRVDRDKLVEYYETHYVPEKMAVVVVGDIDTGHLRQRVAETLGSITNRPAPPFKRVVERGEPDTKLVVREIPTALVHGALSWPAPAAHDLKMNVAGDVLVELLASSGVGRLRKSLVEEFGWADAVSVSFPTSRDPARFTVIYVSEPGREDLIADEIVKEVRRLRVDGISQKELDAVRDKMKRDERFRDQSVTSGAFSYGFWYVVSDVADEWRYEKALDRLRPRDIKRFARRYLSNEAIELKVSPVTVASGDAAAKDERIVFQEAATSVTAVGVFIDGGQSIEPSPGYAALLAGTMNRGTQQKDHETFEREQAAAGVTLGASSLEDMISIIGVAESGREAMLIDMIFEIIEQPRYKDFDIVRSSLEASLRSRNEQPFSIAFDELVKKRFPGHAYGYPPAGTPESLSGANIDDLEEFRRRLLEESGIRVVIVGPVGGDSAALASAVRRRLSKTKNEGIRPNAVRAAEAEYLHIPAERDQVMLVRSYPAPDVLDPEYPVFKVVNALLGGRSSSRLFRIVREERGLAYAVGSFFPSRELASHLVVYAGTRPELVSEVRGLLDESLYEATELEVEDAKKLILGEFALDHELVQRRAWYLGWYASVGIGHEYDQVYPEQIRAVDADDVNRVLEELSRTSPIEVQYGGQPLADVE